MIRVLHVGLGPIGAAVARQIASRKGFRIVGAIDIDPKKIAALHRGENYLKHLGATLVSDMKNNGRFDATVATSVGFNQTASAFGDSYDSPLGRQQLSVGINLPMVQCGRARLLRAHLTRV